jgi:PIN domain nuclease of toxin-antitoxin system
MKYLVDSQLLIWGAYGLPKLSAKAKRVLNDEDNELYFSAASIWEIAIKRSLNRLDFDVDPRVLRRGLVDSGYIEIPVISTHGEAVLSLPQIHNDPFDRLLLAQAQSEGMVLLTADKLVAKYPGSIALV